MKKEKKTKQKKTKKYKIWFVIMIIPILLLVLPINAYATQMSVDNTNLNNLLPISYYGKDNQNESNSTHYINNYNSTNTEITFDINAYETQYIGILYYLQDITNITHITAEFEVKYLENNNPIKRLSNYIPQLFAYNSNNQGVAYNLTVTEYVNRYKYSINSDVDIGYNNYSQMGFRFNINASSGSFVINYISIIITYGEEETTEQEQETVDISEIESQLNELMYKKEDITTNNIKQIRIYGASEANGNLSWYNHTYNIIDEHTLEYDITYNMERQFILLEFDSIDISNIYIEMTIQSYRNNINTGVLLSDYGAYWNTQRDNNGTNAYQMQVINNNTKVIYKYNGNVNLTTSQLYIYTNYRGLSYYPVRITDFTIKINDVEYQIKISSKNAENAVSEYESIISELYPNESELDSALNMPNDIISNIDELEEFSNIEQYNNFSINVFNESPFYLLLLPICGAFMLMGFILFGKAR